MCSRCGKQIHLCFGVFAVELAFIHGSTALLPISCEVVCAEPNNDARGWRGLGLCARACRVCHGELLQSQLIHGSRWNVHLEKAVCLYVKQQPEAKAMGAGQPDFLYRIFFKFTTVCPAGRLNQFYG